MFEVHHGHMKLVIVAVPIWYHVYIRLSLMPRSGPLIAGWSGNIVIRVVLAEPITLHIVSSDGHFLPWYSCGMLITFAEPYSTFSLHT
jgi:hypothetical protein